MIPVGLVLGIDHFNHVCDVRPVGYAGVRYTPVCFPDPAARAARPVRNGAPNVTSQIEAAKALRNRLHADVVTHTYDDAA